MPVTAALDLVSVLLWPWGAVALLYLVCRVHPAMWVLVPVLRESKENSHGGRYPQI